MLAFYKYSLGPVLLLQAYWLRKTALHLPEAAGPREGTEGDMYNTRPPIRLLFVGDSSAAGVGVEHQSQAFAQPVAQLISQRFQRPVEWQLLAKSGLRTHEAIEMLQQSVVRPADFLVIAIGTNDVTSQRHPLQFMRDYECLVAQLRLISGAQGVVTTGLPPLRILPAAPQPLRWYLGRYAARLDSLLKKWLAKDMYAHYVSLDWAAKPLEMARDRFHPGAGQYVYWAELVADRIAEFIRRDNPEPSPMTHEGSAH